MDLLFSAGGLLVFAVPMLAAAVWVRLDSPGPVFFRQERIGQGGRLFRIHKFRTMHTGADRAGPALTVAGDRRITRAGRWLRRSKLDELPQLIDVLRGEMSIVGPRPEVPRYLPDYPAALLPRVLPLKPGITDPVSLEFADESTLLAAQPEPERYYREVLLPRKLEAAARYAEGATWRSDLRVIGRTIGLLGRRL